MLFQSGATPNVLTIIKRVVEQSRALVYIAMERGGAPRWRVCGVAAKGRAWGRHTSAIQVLDNLERRPTIRKTLKDPPHNRGLLGVLFQTCPNPCRLSIRIELRRMELRHEHVPIGAASTMIAFQRLPHHPTVRPFTQIVQENVVQHPVMGSDFYILTFFASRSNSR